VTRRICVAMTTRGNYGKLKSVMRGIQAHPELELQVVVGGSLVLDKYGRILDSEVVDQFQIDHEINFVIEGENPATMAKSAGLAVTEFSNAFINLKPDVVIVIADRYECLAIAMAATYMNIPVVHLEGGEVSGSIDEMIRHAVTKMSNLHFPCMLDAAQRIERMGENPDNIRVVGSTSFDVLAALDLESLDAVRAHQKEAGVGDLVPIEAGRYLIVIQHPVTTEYEANLAHIEETAKAIDELQMPTFWVWPNLDAGSDGISKGIRMYRELSQPTHVHFFKSLPLEMFGPLLANAACIVGNSSSGIREAAFLGTPTVNVGTRQHGRQRGHNVIDVDYGAEAIMDAVRKQVENGCYTSDPIYGDGKAAEKIVPILAEFNFKIQKTITY
jgi:UDP-hydrolysing UDP-N-acetyl-D-glucosamine 2-epimerase